ncbi:post-GPI attachment to proteins factor 2 isoform X2 [Strongylocentrotus purpuratus]|uniref:CWH43-like N-terminal domain-containing protein n=1 Tax=Strongylocentrotus purpuratus TaxID=7668 RepID=A0A7M7NHG6_STRPU|nr:post-GPI attachment to proteins factor 2 isoform X2 [Strongylocentrotus purpuratus]|eukprot:XP_011680628.1 PREDICTED: post-GPI attachment to proteins factor 2 isoform X2 [Strongylocentrotus purpuratus]
MMLNEGRFSSSKGIHVTVSRLITIMMCVMVVGFLMSIALALIYSFEATTSTHCRVKNYLPSISAAIAEPPSSYVWRFVIVLCSGQRLFCVAFHYGLYASVNSPNVYYTLLCKACFTCELVENFALIGLTCVSSSENFPVHENMFIVFQVCSMIFMVLMCAVHKLAISSGIPPSKSEQSTLNRLYLHCGTNVSSFFIAIYFYFRHTTHCETGIYTLFAFFEYIVVLTNIAFHYIVTFNFQERELVLGRRIHGI